MKHTESALDADSYEWLEAKNEKLLAAIEADVRQGATPEEIFKLVMRRKDNRKLALICEQAARYVASQVEPVSALDRYGVKE